jgi:hypothetical protein
MAVESMDALPALNLSCEPAQVQELDQKPFFHSDARGQALEFRSESTRCESQSGVAQPTSSEGASSLGRKRKAE